MPAGRTFFGIFVGLVVSQTADVAAAAAASTEERASELREREAAMELMVSGSVLDGSSSKELVVVEYPSLIAWLLYCQLVDFKSSLLQKVS